MPHPTARVLAVLELLQTHGRMSGAELASRLEVDGRTLRRYITTLEELGIPVTAERGRHGAYLLVTGFKLPPLMFTDDETLAISIGLLAARNLGLAEAAPAVASAQAKLERVMPANLRGRLRALTETASLDMFRATASADNKALLELAAAAQARNRVHLRHRSFKGDATQRDFDPYGLVYRNGHWYVGGMCHLRNDLRSFRLDRVESVRVLKSTFVRPEGVDVGENLARSVATIPRAHRVEVLLHTDMNRALSELPRDIGVFEPMADGVLLRGGTDSIDWYARLLSRLSFPFEIRQPAVLRQSLRAHSEKLRKLTAAAPRTRRRK